MYFPFFCFGTERSPFFFLFLFLYGNRSLKHRSMLKGVTCIPQMNLLTLNSTKFFLIIPKRLPKRFPFLFCQFDNQKCTFKNEFLHLTSVHIKLFINSFRLGKTARNSSQQQFLMFLFSPPPPPQGESTVRSSFPCQMRRPKGGSSRSTPAA